MISILTTIIVYAVPAVLAITLHEAAHGAAAAWFGDRTAYALGRVTVNPVPHIDPVGTLLVPGLLLLGTLLTGSSGLLFGWAKPVPVVPSRMRNPRTSMIWVSLAGPASNLAQAVIWALTLKFTLMGLLPEAVTQFALRIAVAGIQVNLMLMAFNLIPILPLDGGRVLTNLLPYQLAARFESLERYGFMILMVLIVSGLLDFFIRPFLMFGQAIVNWLI